MARVGVIFGGIQYWKSVEIDRRQTSIEILKPTRQKEVLASLRRLQVARKQDPDSMYATAELIADADLVLNTYDSVAIHYVYDAVDKCLVKDHIYTILPEVIDSLRALGYLNDPVRRVKDLKDRLDRLDGRRCPARLE